MRGIAPAAFRLRGAVGLAYATASQTSEAAGGVRDYSQALRPEL